jgi:putative SOS response-associated peptidase YedK
VPRLRVLSAAGAAGRRPRHSRPAHDRMPVILDPRHHAGWLDSGLADVEGLQPWLRPFSADAMEAFPVSDLVNSARDEGPDCAMPLTPA